MIMANSKSFWVFMRRTLESLTLLAKPFYTFEISETDAVDAYYCWLKNYMGRRQWFDGAFALSGTKY